MIDKNKFSKYTLYALGEIILVVIGILIALQINNWNENRKQRIIEKESLIILRKELKNNIDITDASLERNMIIVDTIIQFLKGSLDTSSLKNKANIAMITSNHSPLQLSMPAIEQELNISQKIKSLPELRQALQVISYNHGFVIKRLTYLDQTFSNHIGPLMMQDGIGRSFISILEEWDDVTYDIGKLIDIPNYDDILSVKIAQLQTYVSWMKKLYHSQQRALDIIEMELKENSYRD